MLTVDLPTARIVGHIFPFLVAALLLPFHPAKCLTAKPRIKMACKPQCFLALTTLALLACLHIVASTADIRPTQTDFAHDAANLIGWTPIPTSLAEFVDFDLFRRYSEEDKTCGYVSGKSANALTCNNGNLCGINTNLGVAGCCSSTFLGTDGTSSLTGCGLYTACVDYASSAVCDAACQLNSNIKKWLAFLQSRINCC